MEQAIYIYDNNTNDVAMVIEEDNTTYTINSIQRYWQNGNSMYRNVISKVPKKSAVVCGEKVTEHVPFGTRVLCISSVGSSHKSLIYGTVKAYRKDIENVIGVEFDNSIGGHDLRSVIYTEFFDGSEARDGYGWWVDMGDLYLAKES